MNTYYCEIRKRRHIHARSWIDAKEEFLKSIGKGNESMNIHVRLITKNKK